VEKRTVAIAASVIVAVLLLNCCSVIAQLQPPAPTIDQPPPVDYVVGTTGHNITWHPLSEIPANYTIEVLERGMPGPPFPIVWCANWTGGSISQNVDGWDEGTYYYTCIVYDTEGRSTSSTVTVTIISEKALQGALIIVAGIGAIVAICIVVAIVNNRTTKPKLPV
jgi:hypothetical protein